MFCHLPPSLVRVRCQSQGLWMSQGEVVCRSVPGRVVVCLCCLCGWTCESLQTLQTHTDEYRRATLPFRQTNKLLQCRSDFNCYVSLHGHRASVLHRSEEATYWWKVISMGVTNTLSSDVNLLLHPSALGVTVKATSR